MHFTLDPLSAEQYATVKAGTKFREPLTTEIEPVVLGSASRAPGQRNDYASLSRQERHVMPQSASKV